MLPDPRSEATQAENLAQLRWGPTGFRCPRCDHRYAYTLRTRPRVRECRRCGRQISVTSGTLMHRTRLPLSHWAQRGEELERSPRIPTTSELVVQLQVARSTAWLLNQKILCASVLPLEGRGPFQLWRVRVRRPRPSPPLCAAAPAWLRELHDRHRLGQISPVHLTCALELVGDRARLEQVGVLPEEAPHYIRRSVGRGEARYAPASLFRWLHTGLTLAHRTVSLRWLPRWLAAELASWNRGLGELRWARAALALGPRPLHLLDPWLGLFPQNL
jgi:transposase-like protein